MRRQISGWMPNNSIWNCKTGESTDISTKHPHGHGGLYSFQRCGEEPWAQTWAQDGHRGVLARPEGFEPPTNGFGSRYSIQLSYGRVFACYIFQAKPKTSIVLEPGTAHYIAL